MATTTHALLIRLDAQRNKEDDVEALLRSIQPLVGTPSAARSWFALRMAPAIYGLFSTFNNDADRDAYVSVLDRVWAERASELLSRPAVIEKVEILVGQPNAFTEVAGLGASSNDHRNTRASPVEQGPPEVPKVGSEDAPGG
jgi:hypothetical protein